MNTFPTQPGCVSRTLLAVLIFLGAAQPVFSLQWHEHGAIQAAAENAARESLSAASGRLEIKAEGLDQRLRLPSCESALTTNAPGSAQDSARLTIEVKCMGRQPWRLFVPVRVSLFRDVVVAATPIERGKILAGADVILAERDVTTMAGRYLTQVDAVAGKTLRRTLPAGATLTASLLEAPQMIRRGQQVSLEARTGAITVQMSGIAQADGALGQTIGVANESSRRIVQGIVRNEKTVEVPMPGAAGVQAFKK